MKGIAPTHLECNECGTRRPLEDDEDLTNLVCEPCQAREKDPTCVQLVAIVPCPDGVTAEKAAAGEAACGSDEHVTLTGMHVIEVD